MENQLFNRFATVIKSLSNAEMDGNAALYDKLRMVKHENIEICYAPFEHINRQARVVIVGITPGRTQMLNAINEARRQIDQGADASTVLMAAKRSAGFSGAMRPNLVSLLDSVGLHRWLGIPSCDDLFGTAANLMQTASVLRNPVFLGGKNYNGTPNMTRNPLLRDQLLTHFGEDVKAFPKAIFIPLGDTVAEALNFLADQGRLDRNRILDGLPHPSGANAERIAYFVGRKSKDALSVKTDPTKLDKARESIIKRVMALA
jgi:hypothetical protein